MSFNLRVFRTTLPDFLNASLVTLEYAIIAIIIAILWGIIIGSVNYRKVKGIWRVTSAYVCFFRETPLLVQIYFLFFGLNRLIPVNAGVIGVAALVLNDGAFIAEIVRGGLQSISKGQSEAAYSLGFSNLQTLVYFLIPQAVTKVQDSVITELTYMAHRVNSKYYQPLTAYLVAAAIYMIMFLAVQGIKKLMDRRSQNKYELN